MRLFWALALPDAIKDRLELVQDALRARCPAGVRWVRREQLHVTCKFVGDADPGPIAAAVAALPPPGPLRLELDGIGAFGGRRPRVVWAGLAGPDLPLLEAFAADVEAALETAGVPREGRPFKAHVTLGRAKRGRGGPPRELTAAVRATALEPLPFTATELVLFQSSLGLSPGPVSYSPVSRYSLTTNSPRGGSSR